MQQSYESATSDARLSSPPPVTSPLGEPEFALIRQAVIRRRKIGSAARMAKSSSMVTLTIGALGIPIVLLWWSLPGLLIASAICAIGVVEFMGYRRMYQARPLAARMLGANQLAFLAVIILYCLVQMLTFSTDRVKAAALSPETRFQLGALSDIQKSIDREIDRWAPILTYGFYSLVIVLSICFQGGLSLYYFTRRKHIESFNRNTPQWIRRLFTEIGA